MRQLLLDVVPSTVLKLSYSPDCDQLKCFERPASSLSLHLLCKSRVFHKAMRLSYARRISQLVKVHGKDNNPSFNRPSLNSIGELHTATKASLIPQFLNSSTDFSEAHNPKTAEPDRCSQEHSP